MHTEKLRYSETARRFEINDHKRIIVWKRVYLEEEPEGVAIERRGWKSSGRPRKLSAEVEADFIAENQRLRMENAYLKNVKPWSWRTSDASAKSPGSPGSKARISPQTAAGNRSVSPCNILLSSEVNE